MMIAIYFQDYHTNYNYHQDLEDNEPDKLHAGMTPDGALKKEHELDFYDDEVKGGDVDRTKKLRSGSGSSGGNDGLNGSSSVGSGNDGLIHGNGGSSSSGSKNKKKRRSSGSIGSASKDDNQDDKEKVGDVLNGGDNGENLVVDDDNIEKMDVAVAVVGSNENQDKFNATIIDADTNDDNNNNNNNNDDNPDSGNGVDINDLSVQEKETEINKQVRHNKNRYMWLSREADQSAFKTKDENNDDTMDCE